MHLIRAKRVRDAISTSPAGPPFEGSTPGSDQVLKRCSELRSSASVPELLKMSYSSPCCAKSRNTENGRTADSGNGTGNEAVES
jgi:hypothetical protein